MIAYITLGGIAGTLARWFLQGWIQHRSGLATFPVGTLAINLIGSLIIGFVIRLATGSTIVTPELRGALTIGFCGAFARHDTVLKDTHVLQHSASPSPPFRVGI